MLQYLKLNPNPNYIGLTLQESIDTIISFIKDNTKEVILYHNINHALDVHNFCLEYIDYDKELSLIEVYALKIASIIHDIGFCYGYFLRDSNIAIGLSNNIIDKMSLFPIYGRNYSAMEDVSNELKSIVSNLIISTKRNKPPINRLEKIMMDADLCIIIKDNFLEANTNLKKELRLNGYVFTEHEWYHSQILFLERHKFYTNFANNKLSQIDKKNWEYIRKLNMLQYKRNDKDSDYDELIYELLKS